MSALFDSSRVHSDIQTSSNGGIENDPVSSSNILSASETLSSLNHGSMRYELTEMFDVWYRNGKALLNQERNSLYNDNENYKSEFPNQLLHLKLQNDELNKKNSVTTSINANSSQTNFDIDPSDLSKRLETLSTNDSGTQENWTSNQTLNPLVSNLKYDNASSTSLNSQPVQPPGITRLQDQPFVSTETSKWYYLDSSGSQQGPFEGTTMQQWYEAQYFNFELPIRKEHDSHFVSLKEFCDSINNYTDPFKPAFVPPPPPPQPPAVSQFYGVGSSSGINTPSLTSSGLLLSNNSLFGSGGFLNDSFGITPQLQQVPLQSSSSLNGWGSNSTFQVQIPQPSSPWANHVSTNHGRINSPFAQNFSVSSPNVQPQSATSNLVNINDFGTSYPSEDDHHQLITSSVIGGILSDNEDDQPQNQQTTYESNEVETKASTVLETNKPAPTQETDEANLNAQSTSTKSSVEPTKNSPESSTIKASTTPKVSVAPWASKANVSTAPKRSLKEIQQEYEQAKLKEDAQTRLEESRKLASQLLAEELEAASIAAATRPALPKTASWAGGAQSIASSVPKKTLLEVQREQEAKKAKERAVANFSLAAAKSSKAGKPSFASTAAAAQSVADDGTWTVVSKTKPQPRVPTSVQAPTNVIKNASPTVLRTISATSYPPATSKVVAAASSTVSRDEFLSWCRSALSGLDKSIGKDDLLNMFFDLPINGSDTPSLIGEIFDSYTLSRGGAKFAAEFIKRRQNVESVTGYVFWSEAIKQTANKPEDDGWSSTTKSKRKSKKN